MRGMRYSPKEKERALRLWLVEGNDILWVAKKTKCTERSLWRWKALYDGTLKSLENGSCVPHTPHFNAHTKEERRQIVDIFTEHPDITYAEALGILRQRYAYSRTYYGLYRFVVKNGLRPHEEVKEVYKQQPYFPTVILGQKWQLDLKYVPKECYLGELAYEKFYQYTIIDEATRERFIYAYNEHSGWSTVDFIKRAIAYFGYMPHTIQTDNGTEFTTPANAKEGTVHIMDILLKKLRIRHKLIAPRTPRHNGKVERSHRSDQEAFYNHLTFRTLPELQEKMGAWLNRYNDRPHSQLRNKEGKRVWYSPRQKRAELLELLKECRDEYRVRFIKTKAA